MTTHEFGQAALRRIRPIRIEGDVAYVPLTKGYEAKIDAADVPLVDGWNWTALVQPHAIYARRCANGRTLHIHRLIMDAPDGLQVDHISGDGLDNRRSNLRLATVSQNRHNQRVTCRNTSGFKGVCWHKTKGAWVANIRLGETQRYLGRFNTAEDAYVAYCKASAELHGEFGRVA